jgi:thymidylate synthase ThyX
MQVYALTNVPPEVQAYAMAKYSRSAQSMRDSIGELSAQRAEQFLNTFYFQYGHRSIADLAHVALAVEEISILAAIRLVDEPLWDGQERSTRYQDFRKSGYHVPAELAGGPSEVVFRGTANGLFQSYHTLSRRLTDLLADAYPCPPESDDAAHRRTLRARAFDVARYLLPLATRTSVGQITSARVLERQIARLRADPLAEVRAIGDAMRLACSEPGYDLARERVLAALNGQAEATPALCEALAPVAPAPTLVRYADPSPYAAEAQRDISVAAAAILGDVAADRARAVELAEPTSPEEEAVTTLLYGADVGGRSYRQVHAAVKNLSAAQCGEVLDLAFRRRGPHDEWPRAMHAGYALTFDILVDAGAFRDLHRHRRCVQIIQPFTAAHGFDDPRGIVRLGLGAAADTALESGVAEELGTALAGAGEAARRLSRASLDAAAYLLPLGYRVRAAFKMDVAEAAYIAELRTKPGGHFSYRRVAHQMYEALAERYPALARHVRVTDPEAADSMLER